MILNTFGARRCVSGLPVRELLVASHIEPWSTFPQEQLTPQNGLYLSYLLDRTFDAGLFCFDAIRKLLMSRRQKEFLPHAKALQSFEAFAGTPFTLPEEGPEPSADLLRYHREKVFD